ncbi:unnamed protein product [Prorocentrum cordatum]|uniref:Uncharacterized protein n=1 Tax=Prorocentrum cordatum TaxID=2364126 RepID=A0ABN9RI06_9DINO|nr:unnamed protein product [Polarella glacialis]
MVRSASIISQASGSSTRAIAPEAMDMAESRSMTTAQEQQNVCGNFTTTRAYNLTQRPRQPSATSTSLSCPSMAQFGCEQELKTNSARALGLIGQRQTTI